TIHTLSLHDALPIYSGETLVVKYTHASNCHTIKRAIATATTGSGSGSLTPTLIFIPVPGLLRASGGGPQPPARRNAAHRASRVRSEEHTSELQSPCN